MKRVFKTYQLIERMEKYLNIFLSGCLLTLVLTLSDFDTDAQGGPVEHLRRAELTEGLYQWFADESSNAEGIDRIRINTQSQTMQLYSNGKLIGRSKVCTGKEGFETPKGTFSILKKKRQHTSNLYGNAQMPYMLLITETGIAIHSGKVYSRPASHGCIRIPPSFAKKLFDSVAVGTEVIVI